VPGLIRDPIEERRASGTERHGDDAGAVITVSGADFRLQTRKQGLRRLEDEGAFGVVAHRALPPIDGSDFPQDVGAGRQPSAHHVAGQIRGLGAVPGGDVDETEVLRGLAHRGFLRQGDMDKRRIRRLP